MDEKLLYEVEYKIGHYVGKLSIPVSDKQIMKDLKLKDKKIFDEVRKRLLLNLTCYETRHIESHKNTKPKLWFYDKTLPDDWVKV